MTETPSLGRRLLIWARPWTHSSRVLGRMGFVLVAIAFVTGLDAYRRPPAPLPESLAGLERVVGALDSIAVDYAPSYLTKVGRQSVMTERKPRGWLLTLKASNGERTHWSVRKTRDTPKLDEGLKPGTALTAYARDGQIFQLEDTHTVLVDLEKRRSTQRYDEISSLWALVVVSIGAVAICARATLLFIREP